MDTSLSLLLPSDRQLLDAIEASTAAHLAALVDAGPCQPRRAPATALDTLPGYRFLAQARDFGDFVAAKHAWAVRALACCDAGTRATPAQHLLELEVAWMREDVGLLDGVREHVLDHLIELVQGLDAVLVFQAGADADCLSMARACPLDARERESVEATLLNVYRQRHIAAGFHRRQFALLLGALLTGTQRARLERELAPIVQPLWRLP